MHIRAFDLAEIPLGKFAAGEEGTEEEKLAFGAWLYERWAEKDALMERFRTQGTFVTPPANGAVHHGANGRSDAPAGLSRSRNRDAVGDQSSGDEDEDERPGEYRWPVALRHPGWEVFAAFQFGWPLVVAALLWLYGRSLLAETLSIAFAALFGHGSDRQVGLGSTSSKVDL